MRIDALIREAFHGWEPVREIGQGAYSRVYSVKNGEKVCAVKALFVPDDHEGCEELSLAGYTENEIEVYLKGKTEALTNEINLMRELGGKRHTVGVIDSKVLHPEKLQYVILIRMELLTPLGRLPQEKTGAEEVRKIASDVADALSFLHSRRVLHRDIKPSNIFLSAEGEYLLGDFGISRRMDENTLTVTHTGTPQYMAPEACFSAARKTSFNDAALGDVYSLGMVMYYLLNENRLPFMESRGIAGEKERENAFKLRMSGEPLPLPSGDAPKELKRIALKAAEFKPQRRYSSAEEMKKALEDVYKVQKEAKSKPKRRLY